MSRRWRTKKEKPKKPPGPHYAKGKTGECRRCGGEFVRKAANQVFCKRSCMRPRHGKKQGVCGECGRGVILRQKDQRFCSPKCRRKWHHPRAMRVDAATSLSESCILRPNSPTEGLASAG